MATGRKKATDDLRASVTVETAVLTVEPGAEAMSVLQVRRDGGRGWALPGTFLRRDERLAEAVLRSLPAEVDVDALVPRQLHVLDEPDRDDHGWVLSVAHLLVVPAERLAERSGDTRLQPVEAPGRLPRGQGETVAMAVADLRERYEALPDPDHVLPDEFTMLELRRVHSAVAGRPLQKDTFRRAMEPGLRATGTTTTGARGRPAELFGRAG